LTDAQVEKLIFDVEKDRKELAELRALRDGERVRVPLYMMDETQREVAGAAFDAAEPVNITDAAGNVVATPARGDLHRPGYRFPTPAIRDVREAVYQTGVAMMRDAWRTKPVGRTPLADAETEYRNYCDRIANSWKTA
jgi:hypothetical protein